MSEPSASKAVAGAPVRAISRSSRDEFLATWAVVVNWNGGDENLDCVASLIDQHIRPERIVFVDNASADGSLERVRSAHPGLRFVVNDVNEGFGAAANRGARLALEGGAEAVFFVNNDVVLPKKTLARLEGVLAERPGVSIVGPRILFKDDPQRVWSAGGELTWRQNLSTLIGNGRLDGPFYWVCGEVDYVAGAAMLVRANLFERIGFFEADYFAYMEDVDFCLAARRAGTSVVMCGEVAALHGASNATGGGYSARRKYMNGVNSVRFLRKYGSARRWASFVLWDVLPLPILFLVGVFRGRGRAVAAKALGILHGLLGKRVTAEKVKAGGSLLW